MGSYENLKPFKKGHKKLGGRKKGVPNKSSLDLQKNIIAAMDRLGSDGKGTGGYVGFISSLPPNQLVKLAIRALAIEKKATPKRVVKDSPTAVERRFGFIERSEKLTERDKRTSVRITLKAMGLPPFRTLYKWEKEFGGFENMTPAQMEILKKRLGW
jgi:hypothetical protein